MFSVRYSLSSYILPCLEGGVIEYRIQQQMANVSLNGISRLSYVVEQYCISVRYKLSSGILPCPCGGSLELRIRH
jgi:hypothetical protein